MDIKISKFNDYDNEGFGLGIHSLRRAVYYSVGDIYKDMTGVFLVLSVDKHGYRFFDFKGENSRDYFNSPEEAYEDLYKKRRHTCIIIQLYSLYLQPCCINIQV